jgi:hypothetical protein
MVTVKGVTSSGRKNFGLQGLLASQEAAPDSGRLDFGGHRQGENTTLPQNLSIARQLQPVIPKNRAKTNVLE